MEQNNQSTKKSRRVVYKVRHIPSGLYVAKRFPTSHRPFELTANGRIFTTLGYVKTSFKGKGIDWSAYTSQNGHNLGTASDYEVVEFLLIQGATFPLTGKWLNAE